MKRVCFVIVAALSAVAAWAVEPSASNVQPKVYVAPMAGGFETYVSAAIMKKGVPVTVVADRNLADYEISGDAESKKAGWAKIIFTGSIQSDDEASIRMVNIKTGEMAFAYAVNKKNSFRGKQSAAESCAKHLKNFLQGKG
jgi:hypothetical protein